MEYRQFGSTDLKVSVIGFGAWAIGGAARVGAVEIGWGPADDNTSIQAIKSALDEGINFFDTADFYGLGHSETLLGNTIGHVKDAIIATKVGQKVGNDGNIEMDYSKAHLVKACDESLTRLKRDYIDYYQLHVAKLSHLQEGSCIEAMEELKEQGKIRYWGISLPTFQPEPEADFLMSQNMGDGFQLVLNLLNQIAIPVIEKAGTHNKGIIARMPLQFGLLTGKFKSDAQFSTSDHRANRLTPTIIERTLDMLRADVVPIAKQYNTNLASIALSFILGFKEVSTVIPGIRTAEQVKKNTAFLVNLSAADHQYLKNLYETKGRNLLEIIQRQG